MVSKLEELIEGLIGCTHHESLCILSQWRGGEPSPEGYKLNYGGKWYLKDQIPPCECGLDLAIELSRTYAKGEPHAQD